MPNTFDIFDINPANGAEPVVDSPKQPRNILNGIPAASNVFDGKPINNGNATSQANVFDQFDGNVFDAFDEPNVLDGILHPAAPLPNGGMFGTINLQPNPSLFSQVKSHGPWTPEEIAQEQKYENDVDAQLTPAPIFTLPRAIVADTAAGIKMALDRGDAQDAEMFSGNIPAALEGKPLPIDQIIKQEAVDKDEIPAVTAAKISTGLADSAPLLATSFLGLPAWAGRLIALGFTGQMIANAGSAARALGAELGKNPENRSSDVISSAVSDLVQDFGFAPFTGLHGSRDIVERYADKPMYAIRQLSDQLQNGPIIQPGSLTREQVKTPAIATDQNAALQPNSSDVPNYVYSAAGVGGFDDEATRTGVKNYLRREINVPPIKIVNDPTWTHNGYGVRGAIQDGQIIVNRAFIDSAETLQQVLREEHNHSLLSSEAGRQAIRDGIGNDLGKAQLAELSAKYPILSGESVPNYRARLTDEFISKAASEQLPIWQRVVERVKGWLADNGIGELNDAETARAIIRALKSDKPAALTPKGSAPYNTFDSASEETMPGNDNLGTRYNLTDEPLQGISRERATEAINQLFGTKQLPPGIVVNRNRFNPSEARTQRNGVIAVNAARVSTPEQAPHAALLEGIHRVWYRPEIQRAWQYVRRSVTPQEFKAEFNRRQARGLRTDPAIVREAAAMARLMNSDGRKGVVGGFHNVIRAQLRKKFNFNVPAMAHPQFKEAVNQFLRDRTIQPAALGLPPKPIVDLGQWGESWLRHVLQLEGTKPSSPSKTRLSFRYIDRLFDQMAHEAKAGLNVKLNNRIRTQILKDADLIKSGQVDGAHWHFFRGAEPDVLRFLEQNGIGYTVY